MENVEENVEFRLSPPWYTHLRKLQNLFMSDPDVVVDNDLTKNNDGSFTAVIHCATRVKYDALLKVIKPEVKFGNVVLKVEVVADVNEQTPAELMNIAFGDNDLYVDTYEIVDAMGSKHVYSVFKKDVIQFYNDDLSDYCNNFNGLVADVVKDVIDRKAVRTYVCTECEDLEELY